MLFRSDVAYDFLAAAFLLANGHLILRDTRVWLNKMKFGPEFAQNRGRMNATLRIYAMLSIGHKIVGETFGKLLVTIFVTLILFMIALLFPLIHLNRTIDPIIGFQLSITFAYTFTVFGGSTKHLVALSELSQDFITSHLKYSLNLNPIQRRILKSFRPLNVRVQHTLTYGRLTGPTIMQDVVMARLIDLLLAFKNL